MVRNKGWSDEPRPYDTRRYDTRSICLCKCDLLFYSNTPYPSSNSHHTLLVLADMLAGCVLATSVGLYGDEVSVHDMPRAS